MVKKRKSCQFWENAIRAEDRFSVNQTFFLVFKLLTQLLIYSNISFWSLSFPPIAASGELWRGLNSGPSAYGSWALLVIAGRERRLLYWRREAGHEKKTRLSFSVLFFSKKGRHNIYIFFSASCFLSVKTPSVSRENKNNQLLTRKRIVVLHTVSIYSLYFLFEDQLFDMIQFVLLYV